MTKTPLAWMGVVFGVLVVIALTFVVAREQPASLMARASSHGTHAGVASAAADSATATAVVARAQPAPIRNQALGGPQVNLQSSLTELVARRGRQDPVVKQALHDAEEACAVARWPADSPARRDPRRAWAVEYLTRACAGFDLASFGLPEITDTMPGIVELQKLGESAGVKRAYEDLRTSEALDELIWSSLYLLGQKRFPVALDPTLEFEEQTHALEIATIPMRCAAVNTCGPDSVWAAHACAEDGCAYGTTYEQAMRRRLTPRESEAAARIRQALLAMRTQRVGAN